MRLTGAYFKNHVKKRVSIIGKIIEMNGSTGKMESPCGMTVTVVFPVKPDNPLEGQVVEIVGVVQSADLIMADEVQQFPLEFTLDYDKSLHANAVEIEQTIGGKYWNQVAFSEAELTSK